MNERVLPKEWYGRAGMIIPFDIPAGNQYDKFQNLVETNAVGMLVYIDENASSLRFYPWATLVWIESRPS